MESSIWRKSSYSGDQGGNCVEVAQTLGGAAGVVAVRDSKDPAGPVLTVEPAGFSRFLGWVTAVG
ncbi:hypothetical protein QF032_002488 [Streptomyces achromogenes]|uniref:DUF397 domain-containing protein n=1 Tax=Streptomyces achromogenes TaxID=67255 RepID=A0ABU0PYJ2_STRAH|nr:DUF397 domain-containing protein [Streptomyces achromogenes]MDQ0683467.1 hypothetical protein [Streptomyces achromogenes]MDQ0830644.1 hypothetical protein [Streptomyces achromogenes]